MFGRVLLAFSALTFAQAAAAQNLEPTSVELTAGDLAGGPGHLRATVQVSGAVGSFGWRAYASSTGAVRGSVLIGSFGPISASPGAQTLEQDVTLPATLGGSYFVAIEVDPANAIRESNELDNAFVGATRVRIHAPESDLRVSSVSLRATQGRVGESADVDATIENRGQLAATFDLAAFISPDDAVTPNDPELGRTSVTLAPGEGRRVRITGTVPASLTPGDYVVGVWADPAGSTAEVDALDNLGLAGSRFTTYEDRLSLDTADLPGGTVFISYYALLAASGGDGSYRYGVSHGRLPSGLRLDAATGRIAGIPLESGRHELSIEVRSTAWSPRRCSASRSRRAGWSSRSPPRRWRTARSACLTRPIWSRPAESLRTSGRCSPAPSPRASTPPPTARSAACPRRRAASLFTSRSPTRSAGASTLS
jgi:hypothetical protein